MLEINKIYLGDCLERLKTQADCSADIIYADPPYALGSEIIIRPDGKVDYNKASDFMCKREMPTGIWWEEWYKEAMRVLKHGGHCLMFGMDRQLLLFKYYGSLAGFTEKQSLYWYFISNFPKATDLSKMIDKNAGAEREKLGEYSAAHQSGSENWNGKDGTGGKGSGYKEVATITAPSTPLAQKYDGYKYSIAPLKQTNETIMVFQKPYKTGSCLHDTLAYEGDDEECCCGALDIDGNRVDIGNIELQEGYRKNAKDYNIKENYSKTSFELNYNNRGNQKDFGFYDSRGRYPAQTFCNELAGQALDRQSGVKKSIGGDGSKFKKSNFKSLEKNVTTQGGKGYGDTAGCSKILHKCDFEKEEHDIYFYCPKVSKSERNAGCEGLEEKRSGALEFRNRESEKGQFEGEPQFAKNNHPTVKPISLNEKILKLFKTPNSQRILYPFAGSGSEIIGGIKAGFTDWEGCELNPEYIEIANARIEYWSNKKQEEDRQQSLF